MTLITQSTRFKAAVEMTGFADLTAAYGSFREPEVHFHVSMLEGRGYAGGTPWEVRERYVEGSPIFYLDRIQTPLLMLHGTLDVTVSPYLAGEIFVGMKRLGKRIAYAQYSGEGHDIGRLANKRDLVGRVVAWFDEYLKPSK